MVGTFEIFADENAFGLTGTFKPFRQIGAERLVCRLICSNCDTDQVR
jgi:hypothetical protein